MPTVFCHVSKQETTVRYERPVVTHPQRQYLVEGSGEYLLEVPVGYMGDLGVVTWVTNVVVWVGVVVVFGALGWRRAGGRSGGGGGGRGRKGKRKMQ